MFTLLKQEAMKAWKQNRVYIWAIIAFILPIITISIFVPITGQAAAYALFGGSSVIVSIAMVVLTSLAFTQEFTFGTIRPLLSRQYSRLQVFLAKIITVIVEYFLLIVLAILGTVIGRLIYTAMHHSTIEKLYTALDWQSFLFGVFMTFIGSLFLMAVVLLISNIAKSSAAAISLGIVMAVATSILSTITSYLIQFWEPLKWNPLTIQNVVEYYTGQKAMNTAVHSYFGVDMWVLFVVFAIYVIIMYAIAYLIFNRRSV